MREGHERKRKRKREACEGRRRRVQECDVFRMRMVWVGE
jgi:hypothetical protein